jgi:hypothetical protein
LKDPGREIGWYSYHYYIIYMCDFQPKNSQTLSPPPRGISYG